MLEASAPPVDVLRVGIFRVPCMKYNKQDGPQLFGRRSICRWRMSAVMKTRSHAASCACCLCVARLAEMMATATYQQTENKVTADLELMEEYARSVREHGQRQVRGAC